MQVLRLDAQMQQLAEELKHETSLLVFGRGYNYATALEAALKVRLTCFSVLVTCFPDMLTSPLLPCNSMRLSGWTTTGVIPSGCSPRHCLYIQRLSL